MKPSIISFLLSAAGTVCAYDSLEYNSGLGFNLQTRNSHIHLVARSPGRKSPPPSPFASTEQNTLNRTGSQGSLGGSPRASSPSKVAGASSGMAGPKTPSPRAPGSIPRKPSPLRDTLQGTFGELKSTKAKYTAEDRAHAAMHSGGPGFQVFAGRYSRFKDVGTEAAGKVADAHVDALMDMGDKRYSH